MQLDWGTPLKSMRANGDPAEDEDNEEYERYGTGYPSDLESELHGNSDIDSRFTQLQEISLMHRVVTSFLFDKNKNFAGLTTYDIRTKKYIKHSALAPEDLMEEQVNSQTMIDSYPHTRLVGLRTWKKCDTSKHIL